MYTVNIYITDTPLKAEMRLIPAIGDAIEISGEFYTINHRVFYTSELLAHTVSLYVKK